MSVEEAIRERHAFEDRLRRFLELVSWMDDRELEIALGRLADMLDSDPNRQLQIRVRGEVLKTYFDLRRSGAKKQSSIKRGLARQGFKSWPTAMLPRDWRKRESESEWFVRNASTFLLVSDKLVAAPFTTDGAPVTDVVKRLAP